MCVVRALLIFSFPRTTRKRIVFGGSHLPAVCVPHRVIRVLINFSIKRFSNMQKLGNARLHMMPIRASAPFRTRHAWIELHFRRKTVKPNTRCTIDRQSEKHFVIYWIKSWHLRECEQQKCFATRVRQSTNHQTLMKHISIWITYIVHSESLVHGIQGVEMHGEIANARPQ